MSSGRGVAEPIPADVRAHMVGRSWHDDPRCPAFEALRLLRVPFLDFEGARQEGELVVACEAAEDLLDVFATLFAARFPIARMRRIDHYDGNDDRSMADNNCSAFNFRTIAGADILSHHALGVAVDINPVQNPMILRGQIHPPSGAPFVDRDTDAPGMIGRPGPVVDAFERAGWHWGGDWTDLRDYHHFSQRPR